MGEDYFDTHVPSDQYGFSKYLMTKYAQAHSNIFNLRVFGLFGKYDDWRYRFIPNACCRAVLNKPLVYRQNRIFDFLYMDDLCSIVDWFIQNNPRHSVYNVCSGETFSYEELLKIVRNVSGKQLDIKADLAGFGGEYSGDNARICSEMKNLNLTPMEMAIRQMYAWYEDNQGLIDEKELDGF